MGTVWEALRAASESLNTPAGETLPHTTFTNIFAKSRSRNPTAYPELHATGAQARHCIGALRLVVRDLRTWAPAGSYAVVPYFNFVWELIANLATFYDCLWYHGQWLPPATAQESYDYLLKVGVFHQALCITFHAVKLPALSHDGEGALRTACGVGHPKAALQSSLRLDILR